MVVQVSPPPRQCGLWEPSTARDAVAVKHSPFNQFPGKRDVCERCCVRPIQSSTSDKSTVQYLNQRRPSRWLLSGTAGGQGRRLERIRRRVTSTTTGRPTVAAAIQRFVSGALA